MRNEGPGETRKETLAVSGKTLGSGESEPARKVSVRKPPGMTVRETGHTMTPPGNGKATAAAEAVTITTTGDVTLRTVSAVNMVDGQDDATTTPLGHSETLPVRLHNKGPTTCRSE